MVAILLFTLVDLLLSSFVIGATLWLFFFQSPHLFHVMGREKFVPIMMQMTKLWVGTMFLATTALLMVCVGEIILGDIERTSQISLYPVAIAWVGITTNRWIVVPRALQAGARSHAERIGDNSKDYKSFAIEGGSKTETKKLHVLVMTFGLVGHLAEVASSILLLRYQVASS